MKYTHKRNFMSIAMAALVLVALCAVVSSSGVVAADSGGSKTNVEAPATTGAGLGSAPAVAIWKDGGDSREVFMRGADGLPYYKDPLKVGWHSLGGQMTADPFAASGGAQQMVVSVRGMNGALYWKQTTDKATTWSPSTTGWNKVPTGAIFDDTGPAVYSFGANSIGWLVTGNDHALYWTSWDGTGYQNWKNLGGYVKGSPTVVTRGSNVDVYVGGANGVIYQKSYVSGAWWPNFVRRNSDVAIIADTRSPRASAYGTTREDLFWLGTDGAMHQQTWNQGTPGWTAVTVISTPGSEASSPTAAAGTYNNRIDICVVYGIDNGNLWLVEYYYDSSTNAFAWHGPSDYGTGPGWLEQ